MTTTTTKTTTTPSAGPTQHSRIRRLRAGALAALAAAALLPAAAAGQDAGALAIPFERYELDNGLEVVLHVDRSDPLAAVAMTFHVGSAREVEGRTGFAHLFEHLFFLDSENLGPGGLDRLMTRIGSSTNGSTNRDRTNYFEVVPVDGLEKALWAEADKLGYFIATVNESVVAKEKQVVKNEKRQGVDNRPYGHVSAVVDRALYPDDHPYNWQVIGSLQDLDAATLADVQEFHRRWYGPNNATLVVAGDIDVAETKRWIEKYFGGIPRRETPPTVRPDPVRLAETRLLFHEDNFARLPQLTMAWPTVPLFHPDQYALDVLARILVDGKTSPFYEVIVEEEELAPGVQAFNGSQELAGDFTLRITAFADTDLDAVRAAVERAFARFEEEGVPDEELRRVKAGVERGFYNSLTSALGKAFQLAQYAIFADDPGFLATDLERTLAVSADDVVRVYREYLQDRPFVAASFVPRGSPELALAGSERAEVFEEPIVQGAEPEVDVVRGDFQRTPSAFDRSVEPPYGDPPTMTAPDVWGDTLSNGLQVLGIEDRETPLVSFRLTLRGGSLLEEPGRIGAANLLAETLTEGTARRTPEELEQAIDLLGASISAGSGRESFVVFGSTLARNFGETMALLREIVLEPRFDEDAFALAKQRTLAGLRSRAANPNVVASDVFATLLYGDHVLAGNPVGTLESVEATTLDDVRDYYRRAIVPGVASLTVVGDVAEADVLAAARGLEQRWRGETPDFPAAPEWDDDRAGLYFVDMPGASQSVLRIGYLALAETDPDFWPASVMNFRLGGGGFASDLTQVLREGKGYTYGIGSGFSGSVWPGPFQISSSVRSNVTLEALELVKELVERHGPDFDVEDLEVTKGFLLRTNARAFETPNAKLGLLADMAAYGFAPDYVLARERFVRDATIAEIRALAERWLDADDMVWLVVGDAATQLERLEALGLGEPVLLDREGRPAGG